MARSLVPALVLTWSVALAAGPVAQLRPVSNRYGATTLVDNYRWMETQPNPELRSYVTASAAYADAALARIPGREALRRTMTALDPPRVSIPALVQDGEDIFYLRRSPKDDVARLFARGATGGTEHMLVDPEMLPDVPAHSEIGSFTPSPDGAYVAYIMSDSGPDSAVLRILDVPGKKTLPDRIEQARFAGVAWNSSGTSFYYTRPVDTHAANPWEHLGVFLHRLGTPTMRDTMVLDGAHLPFPFHGPHVVPRLLLPPASDYALAVVSDGVSPEIAVYTVATSLLQQVPAPWVAVSPQGQGATQVAVSFSLAFLLTSNNAPTFRVINEDLADPGLDHARTVLAAVPDGVITGIAAASDALYVTRRQGVGSQLLRLDYRDPTPQRVELPVAGTIGPASADTLLHDTTLGHPVSLVADPRAAGAVFSLESWAWPRSWLRYDIHRHRAVDAGLAPPAPDSLAAYRATETTVVARDGTKIPLSIIARRDVPLDHARPTVIEAYGSYGYAEDPHFLPAALAWADQHGVYAIAHVRGGGELGPPWHVAGQFARKRNTITDLLSCADALTAEGYTSPAHLGGLGINAGAIAIGGAITWAPASLRAAVFRDGLLNPLRATESGPPEALMEFGGAHNPAEFVNLLPIDAYSQVREGTEYPAVLLTGHPPDDADQTWQSAKMAARLEAASTSGRPVLLRLENPRAGGASSTQVDELAFLLWQLGGGVEKK